ncbi:LysM peptidoglycan-binding domain-containing protein [Mariniblastus fucicola]|uniref:LysM domain/BON superfamily protein n=1 Tax=Mariniblastus fucicola TaxID=980251 RepID=A0A5B9P985_9BACT|nr:LysM peptidoglycan-binding domain-containing protein [Mariniblastus fucicola]QEG21450.1 LysM domain/BON superfamily protein [Mariniblastus fucicola]
MRDPFKQNSNKQLVREAQFGFTVIGLLIATLIYVAYFRLNGASDSTPEHIQSSPIAMQVFPNSPNYDRESNRMRTDDAPSFARNPAGTTFGGGPSGSSSDNANGFKQANSFKPPNKFKRSGSFQQANSFQPDDPDRATDSPKPTNKFSPKNSFTSESSPLVSVPKRMMNESNRTARSLRDAAELISESSTRIAALTTEPKTDKPVELVSNPAADGARDSGFKVLKQPEPDAATKLQTQPASFPTFKPTQSNTDKATASKTTAPKENSPSGEFKPLGSGGFKPVKASPPIDKPELERETKLPPLPSGTKFKFEPFNAPTIKAEPDAASLSDAALDPPKAAPVQLPSDDPVTSPTTSVNDENASRLPKLPHQSLSDLRSPTAPNSATTEPLPNPETNPMPSVTADTKTSAQPTTTQDTAVVKTVSFEKTTWTVKKGDSFWSIAQTHYGDGRFFRALYKQNRELVPGFENLTEGVELVLPSIDDLCQRYPYDCPSDAVHKNDPWRATPDKLMDNLVNECDDDLDRRLYETKTKDTLFKIARRQLGQASRYAELIELNRFRIGQDVTHETELPPGIQLLLPEK